MDIYVGAIKAKCLACGSADWVLVEPNVDLRAMTEIKCANCHRILFYAELVVQTPVEVKKAPDG